MEMKPLWPIPLPIIGVTGAYASGKSIFAHSLCHPSRIRSYDMEKSLASYKDLIGLGLDLIDVPEAMKDLYGDQGFTQRELFSWWLKDQKSIPAGKYSVVAIDPIDELEVGLTEFVKAQYAQYGFSSAEKFASTGGIFWNNVKKEWKRILLDLATRVETVVFTAHLKQVWKHGRPTEEVVPKGKSTLMEVASLYLFLERDVLGVGEERDFAQKPSAIVLKTRLGSQTWSDTEGELVTTPLLPPRLPVATPKEIRKYLLTPPDYSTLKDEEKVNEKELSPAATLILEAQIAEESRMAAEARKETVALEITKDSNRRSAMAAFRPAPDQTQTVQANMEATGRSTDDAPGKDAEATVVTKEEVDNLLKMSKAKGVDEKVRDNLRKTLDIQRVTVKAVCSLPRDRFTKLVAWVKGQ